MRDFEAGYLGSVRSCAQYNKTFSPCWIRSSFLGQYTACGTLKCKKMYAHRSQRNRIGSKNMDKSRQKRNSRINVVLHRRRAGFDSRIVYLPLWRNWTTHRTSNPGIGGSSPSKGIAVKAAEANILHRRVNQAQLLPLMCISDGHKRYSS